MLSPKLICQEFAPEIKKLTRLDENPFTKYHCQEKFSRRVLGVAGTTPPGAERLRSNRSAAVRFLVGLQHRVPLQGPVPGPPVDTEQAGGSSQQNLSFVGSLI